MTRVLEKKTERLRAKGQKGQILRMRFYIALIRRNLQAHDRVDDLRNEINNLCDEALNPAADAPTQWE